LSRAVSRLESASSVMPMSAEDFADAGRSD
jgi:hypothetical protein